jgi:hypothetical protein
MRGARHELLEKGGLLDALICVYLRLNMLFPHANRYVHEGPGSH